MTHYPSNEEVEKTLEEWIDTQHGTAGWQVKLSNLISQTRLSDLDAIIDGVEKYWKAAPSARLTAGVFKEYILDYLTSLKENV